MPGLEAPEVERHVTRGGLELQEVRLDVLEPEVRLAPRAHVGTRPGL